MIKHTKEYGIYYWDTFDNTTFLKDEVDTLEEAMNKVNNIYGSRVSISGADRVDIVNRKGNIVKQFSVG